MTAAAAVLAALVLGYVLGRRVGRVEGYASALVVESAARAFRTQEATGQPSPVAVPAVAQTDPIAEFAARVAPWQ